MVLSAIDEQIRIDVAFSSDNNYAQHMGVSIESLLQSYVSKHDLNIHILYKHLDDVHISNLQTLVKRHGKSKLFFHCIEGEEFKDFPLPNKYHPIEMYFRLKIAEIFPSLDRMLYLDSDIIVQSDISEIYFTEKIQDKMVMAVEEPSILNKRRLQSLGMASDMPYFNSGILLMNLRNMRKKGFKNKYINFINEYKNQILYGDQDVLNAVCEDDWEALPLAWNAYYFIYQRIYDETYYHYKKGDIYAAKRDPKIIHFNQHPKPWSAKCIDPRRALYFKYLKYTPYKEFKVQRRFVLNSILKRHLNNFLLYLQETYPIIFYFIRSIKRSLSNL